MSRGRWLGLGIVVLLGAGFCVRRCQIDIAAPTVFSYGGHERPRVFVSHHPLIPAPGAQVTIRLAPDLPSGVTVRRAFASLGPVGGGPADVRECPAATNGDFACQFTLSGRAGSRVYSGSLELDNGERVSSRAEYRFTVAAALAANALTEVRVPLTPFTALADSYRVDLSWARDPQNYGLPAFVADVESNIYDGLLADPVYRWRDDQLGFHVFTRDAFVTSYYSGLDTRCGKNPWPQASAFPAALDGMEVVGVLHRKGTAGQGIEGTVTAPVPANLFRDCAGRAVRRPGVGTFSAGAGAAESALVAKHEFGHAAFGFGDEYSESDATRRVTPMPSFPFGARCCCKVSDGGVIITPGGGITVEPGGSITVKPRGGVTVNPGGGVTPDGGATPTPTGRGTKRCAGTNGTFQESPILAGDVGLPPCDATNSTITPECWSQPDGGCPSLAGGCVLAEAWLGQSPPPGADPARPNVFPSEPACSDGSARAAAHPGVEDPIRSLAPCQELCGPHTQACPCGAPEFWITDLDSGPTPPGGHDAMGAITTRHELHGGTCTWCVETSLCVRWHRSLGEDAQKTWDACQAPPKSATALERLWRALVELIRRLLAQILNLF